MMYSSCEIIKKPIKVLFITNSLTPYTNQLLSKINSSENISLIAIAPLDTSQQVGAGVHQTDNFINFKVIRLREIRVLRYFLTYKKLWREILKNSPDVIIVSDDYLNAFLVDIPTVFAKKFIGSRLILKSIPFQKLSYSEIYNSIIGSKDELDFLLFPRLLNVMIKNLRISKFLKIIALKFSAYSLRIPNAHVNYVDNKYYWDSYGISGEKIFITRNSIDTDIILQSRQGLEGRDLINPYRVIHVGRLVASKRVDLLILAHLELKKEYPSTELWIVGSGPQEELLRMLTSSRYGSSSIKFLGSVYDPKVLAEIFSQCSLYVLAGMGGLSINEAMAHGKAVICSECDGTEKFLVRDGLNGLFFIKDSIEDLVKKMACAFSNLNNLAEMGKMSEKIIREEVNLNTVSEGYIRAVKYVIDRCKESHKI